MNLILDGSLSQEESGAGLFVAKKRFK